MRTNQRARLTRRGPRSAHEDYARLRALYRRLQGTRSVQTEAIELETYRFWHLDYGEVPYYDQLVFKRHRPIPPESESETEVPRSRATASSQG